VLLLVIVHRGLPGFLFLTLAPLLNEIGPDRDWKYFARPLQPLILAGIALMAKPITLFAYYGYPDYEPYRDIDNQPKAETANTTQHRKPKRKR
jgi:hypothetical protein